MGLVLGDRPLPLVPPDGIEVRRTATRGRGVFARREIAEGDVIEQAPVIVVPADQAAACPVLGTNCFVWGDGTVALALGYGSLYNHSYTPNASYDDRPGRLKVYRALRDIAAGEEITINYNGEPDDDGPVGFEVR